MKTDPKPNFLFDTYWLFMRRRQNIFYRRLKGMPYPWTSDEILQTYKFTNVFRAADRASQYLISEVLYGNRTPTEMSIQNIVFRTILYKWFNKPETWELLKNTVGPIVYENFNLDKYIKVLDTAMDKGAKIYSGAYMIHAVPGIRKHHLHLNLIKKMMDEGLPAYLESAKSLWELVGMLRDQEEMGPFISYQFAIDLNYSSRFNFSEDDFVQPGPGCIDGISKCFDSLGGNSYTDIVKWTQARMDDFLDRNSIPRRDVSLFGRMPTLIDLQNVFCEISKYTRVSNPEVKGKSGRTRIKNNFQQNTNRIEYHFPPKWGINDKIAQWN